MTASSPSARWLHALRNEVNAAGSALAVVQRAMTRGDGDTAKRFLDESASSMERLRHLLAQADQPEEPASEGDPER